MNSAGQVWRLLGDLDGDKGEEQETNVCYYLLGDPTQLLSRSIFENKTEFKVEWDYFTLDVFVPIETVCNPFDFVMLLCSCSSRYLRLWIYPRKFIVSRENAAN